jgi:general stress protein 26
MSDAENLRDVLDRFDTAMLLTGLDGEPNGRPMSIAGQEDDGVLWFITSRTSPKADEVRDDADAVVTLQSRTAYAMVHGHASLVDDRDKLAALWSKATDLYFPEGPTSPDAILLRFTPTRGEYWDMSGTKGLTFVKEAAEALWNGKGVDHPEGSHGHASL